MTYDVAIIGGGPAGSTCASYLRQYRPELRVLILDEGTTSAERGVESPLPPVMRILSEIGAWDKVEAAGFPVNSGSFYRWGATSDLWQLDLLLGQPLEDAPRPAPFEGARTKTTFHLDRIRYDEILLTHAESLGCEVWKGVAVEEVLRDGDRVDGIKLADGSVVSAKRYVDASGVVRAAMGVAVDEPSPMKNVAIESEWESDEWAETLGKEGARARFLSVDNGWLWVVPFGPTRASVGFVTHGEFTRECGRSLEDLSAQARSEEPLLRNARPIGEPRTLSISPFISQRLTGENWFLLGEAAGAVDPIVQAGLMLTQGAARDLAYVLLALAEGEHEPDWLKGWYELLTQRRLRQQIHFADFWYAADSQLTDLRPYTDRIAGEAGFEIDAYEAFQWLSKDGYAVEQLINPSYGFFDLGPSKAMLSLLAGQPVRWRLNEVNQLKMNLGGAKEVQVPSFRDGKITAARGYQRGLSILPIEGFFALVLYAVNLERDAKTVVQIIRRELGIPDESNAFYPQLVICLEAIEALLAEGWIKGDVNKKRPFVKVTLFQDAVALAKEEVPVGSGEP